MEIFSMDNAFFRFMGRLTDLVWLNILTLICSLPLFTAGAAISAMYKVELNMALGEDGAITRGFFSAFKENFSNATKVWFPSFIILIILGSNAYLLRQGVLESSHGLFIAAGVSIAVIAVLLSMFLNYTFAILSRYDNTLKETMKNAGLLMLAFFPRSICIVVIWLFPLSLMMLHDGFLFAWGIYGLSFPGYINAMLLSQIFRKTEKAGK